MLRPNLLVSVSHTMANTIPCPNPVCVHIFSLAELQAAAQLLCPKCGFRMQGKGTPQPPPKAPATKPAMPKLAAAPVVKAAPPKPAVAKPIATPARAKVAIATPVPAQTKPASPVATSSPPMATPIAAAPVQADQPPTASAEESPSDGAFFNPDVGGGTGTLVRSGAKAKKKFNWMRLLVVLFVVGFAASVVVVAVTIIFWLFLGADGLRALGRLEGDTIIGTIRNSKNDTEKIYKLVLPRKDWSPDKEIAKSFGAKDAWKHNTQDFWFALVVKDYGAVKPRDAEMLRDGIEKLEQYFGEAMELAKMAEPVKFGALPAQKLQFAGTVNTARWLGECYMFFNSGIAYWLFIASPDGADIERFGAELPEKNIFTITERRGWREQPVPLVTFASDNAKVDMSAPKDVWEKAENSKNEFETGELSLSGIFQVKRDNRKNALLHVFTIEKKDNLPDSIKAAREYLDAKVKRDNENFKIVHAADATDATTGQKEMGEIADVGNRRGRMIDLKMLEKERPDRYYLLAVINEPDTCYAILCECAWDSRQIWRQEFLDILRTLRVK